MMNETEFRQRYESEIPIYNAWGEYVNDIVVRELMELINDPEESKLFLKIPPKPRVKEPKSIIEKAFYRKKKYSDPFAEITDKVGVRYVVLLVNDIIKVSEVIEKNNVWVFSKDRDFEEEKLQSPLLFDYQSVHYVVKNKEEISKDGIQIPVDTPCEIQIRTLLQHAYAELTHDIVYKPKTRAEPKVLRSVAKSMALIETTDDIFKEVTMSVKREENQVVSFLDGLKALYGSIASADYEEKINMFILDAYRELVKGINLADVESFVIDNKVIKDVIERRRDTSLLYRQPIVLLLLYLINVQRNNCRVLWPLTDSELRPLFTDLGIAFEL